MESAAKFEVVVACRSGVLCRAMRALLSADEAFTARCADEPPAAGARAGVVLVVEDGSNPEGGWPGKERWPPYPRLYLASCPTPHSVLSALQLKACGLLSADAEEPVLAALRGLAKGERASLQSPEALLHALGQGGRAGGRSATAISQRELEVACAVAQGLTYKQIGARAWIGPATVKSHVVRLLRKTALTDRRQLATYFNQPLACLIPGFGQQRIPQNGGRQRPRSRRIGR